MSVPLAISVAVVTFERTSISFADSITRALAFICPLPNTEPACPALVTIFPLLIVGLVGIAACSVRKLTVCCATVALPDGLSAVALMITLSAIPTALRSSSVI